MSPVAGGLGGGNEFAVGAERQADDQAGGALFLGDGADFGGVAGEFAAVDGGVGAGDAAVDV